MAVPMLLSEFDYDLPAELIASRPLPRRDESRMMVVSRREGAISHAAFKDFPEFLATDGILVLNDAKVIPARVWGKKGEAEIEFLFLGEREKGVWEVLCRPARKLRPGDRVGFSAGFAAEVTAAEGGGIRLLRFREAGVLDKLKKIGFAPLPPYIKRRRSDSGLREFDLERYQTVFARKEGAVAAPTAGLHFTPETIRQIEARGVRVDTITLRVGLATFQPVRVERVEDHLMPEERYSVPASAARDINTASAEGRTVTAVGTTVVRAVESAWQDGRVRSGSRATRLFIHPGFCFRVVDGLLTNFHLPRSTLLMLVSAFAGSGLIKKAYEEAVRGRYRFFSYGDCMLIL